MAIVTCPECSKSISTLAPACIHCGAPVEQAPTECAPKTKRSQSIELTGKPLKAQVVMSNLAGICALLWLIGAWIAEGNIAAPAALLVFSLAWLLITKVRIWWNHN